MPRKIEPKRRWSRGGWEPEFSFSSEDEKELRTIVDDDAFVEQMQNAVTYYLLTLENDRSKPTKREVKASLDELEKGLGKFLYSIRNLDERTTYLIAHEWMKIGGKLEDLPGLGPAESFRLRDLHLLRGAIALTSRKLETRPNRETDNASRVLTRAVADTLTNFSVSLSTTETGAFNCCLAIASSKKPQATRNWVRWWCSEQENANMR
jgi:hypothetical protein